MSDSKVRSVLLDTNVWLDYYLGYRAGNSDASRLISLLLEKEIPIYYSSLSLKDVFYSIASCLKADVRESGETLSLGRAQAIREIAWGCADNMSWMGFAAPMNESQVRRAMMLKGLHSDLEDDLVLSCLETDGIDSFVTSDKALLGKSPVPVFTPATFIEYLQSWG